MSDLKNQLLHEVHSLATQAADMLRTEIDKSERPDSHPSFRLAVEYQSWYSVASRVVEQILPERHAEFVEQYQIDKRKELNVLTYGIKDYLLGLTVTRGMYQKEVLNPFTTFFKKFQHQIFILRSAHDCLQTRLADIEAVLQFQLLDSELASAEDLLKKKHLRAAGAVAGVVLESHLQKVAAVHQLKSRKKSPTISEYIDLLRKSEVIDVPTMRLIQRLGDIRNLSVHLKEREPRADEIEDLIVGTKKVIAEVG